MRSHFDRDPAALPRAERLRQAFAGGGDFSFSDHVAGAVQDAITTRLVAQVHADRDRLVARGSRWPRTLSGNDILLHGRSPLHFECVPIGSLSHPVGGRPSHPISVVGPNRTVLTVKDSLRPVRPLSLENCYPYPPLHLDRRGEGF